METKQCKLCVQNIKTSFLKRLGAYNPPIYFEEKEGEVNPKLDYRLVCKECKKFVLFLWFDDNDLEGTSLFERPEHKEGIKIVKLRLANKISPETFKTAKDNYITQFTETTKRKQEGFIGKYLPEKKIVCRNL